MSVLYENDVAVFISHEKYIEKIYSEVDKEGQIVCYRANANLFNIQHPYVNKNRRKHENRIKKIDSDSEKFIELECAVEYIKSTYVNVKKELIQNNIITLDDTKDTVEAAKNKEALEFSDAVYKQTSVCNIEGIVGENNLDKSISVKINDAEYLFPKRCKFYCSNINVIGEKLSCDNPYDLVVIDPPWWNKYIRRKRKMTDDGYSMMYNSDLLNIPVESLIHDRSLVVVWCTNARSNLDSLRGEIFKKWGVKHKVTWYWLKVTNRGEPICKFSIPPGKQPFEQILIATRCPDGFSHMGNKKIIVSTPSALHSNKPPLNEIMNKYLPKNPKCLELFARYLLPDTTSYGLEAIRFQHIVLYQENKTVR